ncbi:MAG: hypothetical protein ACRC7V_01425 [Lachnospiraceae bacterium]
MPLIEDDFTTDLYIAIERSVKLAQSMGVLTEEILDTQDKVVAYF